MGCFWFEPETDKSYTAIVKSNLGQTQKINLPRASQKGVSLTVMEAIGDTINVKISGTVPDGVIQQEYLLVAQTRGHVIFTRSIILDSGEQSVLINKKTLPTGILQLTLFHNLLPLCERLVFINHNDYISLDIEIDKEKYSTREKVGLNLKSITKNGLAEMANLSLSVFHSDTQIDLEKYPNNILTHFLLNSELKGVIEEPAYYFKDDSLSTLTALDNLMLTQGWRRFVWKEILAGQFPQIDFYPESDLSIEGTVSTLFREKPLPNSKVLIQLGSQKKKLYTQQTDSLGRFYFDSLFFYVETPVEIKAESHKGSNRVWISLNDKKEQSQAINYLPSEYQYVDETRVETSFVIYESNSEYIKKKWSLSDTILLEEVSIYGRKVRNTDVFIRPYLNPEFVIDVDEALQSYNATTMPELIEYTYPNIWTDETGIAKASFFNSNQTGKVRVIVEGITVNGKLCRGIGSYEVVP